MVTTTAMMWENAYTFTVTLSFIRYLRTQKSLQLCYLFW
jgi:hypothetical protein